MTSTAKILANENIFCCPGQSEGRQAQKTEGGWKINDSVILCAIYSMFVLYYVLFVVLPSCALWCRFVLKLWIVFCFERFCVLMISSLCPHCSERLVLHLNLIFTKSTSTFGSPDPSSSTLCVKIFDSGGNRGTILNGEAPLAAAGTGGSIVSSLLQEIQVFFLLSDAACLVAGKISWHQNNSQ